MTGSVLDISRRPLLRIKLAQKFHFQGDQVNGEVLLDLPASISGVDSLELKTWAEEKCTWTECHTKKKPSRDGKKTPHVGKGSYKATFHGGKNIYCSIVTLYVVPGGNLKAGTYLVPFTYFLPFKVASSASFKARQFQSSVRHLLQARLIPQAEMASPSTGPTKPLTPKTTKIDANDILEQPQEARNFIASTLHELTVLEKPGFQASLRPYSWQCTYTIPHSLLGAGNLVMTVKKRPEPRAPGDELSLWIEFQNQSQTVVTDVLVALRHTVSARSHAGTFKQITYNHTQWRKQVCIRGFKKSKSSTALSFPLRLPIGLSSTTHGSSTTSEWEVNVSCRYRGKWTVTHYTTGCDVTFPLTLWATDCSVFELSHLLPNLRTQITGEITPADEELNESGRHIPQDSLVTAGKKELISVNTGNISEMAVTVTEWPPVSFEISSDGGKPSLGDLVRLPHSKADQTPAATPEHYQIPHLQCRLDLGVSMSAGLEKRLSLQQPPQPKRKVSRHDLATSAVRRKIAPLQTN